MITGHKAVKVGNVSVCGPEADLVLKYVIDFINELESLLKTLYDPESYSYRVNVRPNGAELSLTLHLDIGIYIPGISLECFTRCCKVIAPRSDGGISVSYTFRHEGTPPSSARRLFDFLDCLRSQCDCRRL